MQIHSLLNLLLDLDGFAHRAHGDRGLGQGRAGKRLAQGRPIDGAAQRSADPFAKPAYTERQRTYARTLRQRYVYTPEMVVDGIGHDSGIDRSTVMGLLDQARGQSGQRIAVSLNDRGPAGLSVSVPAMPSTDKLDVWLVTFDPQHKTQVTRGENRGQELVDYNVVRSLTLLTQWDGSKAAEWTVPSDKLGDAAGIAILVQHTDMGTMVGAAQLKRAGK